MRRILSVFLVSVISLAFLTSAKADEVFLSTDTSDPLYMLEVQNFLSETTLTFGRDILNEGNAHDILRAGETLSYGLNNRLSVGGTVIYQEDFNGGNDGFSSFDIGGAYRMGLPDDNSAHIIYDVLLGLKFGGSSHVRTPGYADSTYYAGLRFGRQWTGVTLAATIKSNWIFKDNRGMAYIDTTPEVYFRLGENWRMGADFVWRKATNEHYDQEWLGVKLIRQFGQTQYIGHVSYGFEGDIFQGNLKVNILF